MLHLISNRYRSRRFILTRDVTSQSVAPNILVIENSRDSLKRVDVGKGDTRSRVQVTRGPTRDRTELFGAS
jgi:hypothetical protein